MRLKGLERAWKAFWMRALARLVPAAPRGAAPDWGARPHRVLYLRYDRIGDMILATGLIRAVAASHPTITLDVLASPANAPVLEGSPHVARVLVFDKKRRGSYWALFRQLRRGHYDAVIDGMILTPSLTTLLLMLATGARYRIGIGGRANDYIYTLPVPPAPPAAHVIEQSGATARPFGVDPERADLHPELALRDDERERAEATWRGLAVARSLPPERPDTRRLLVNVSTAQPRHRWPDERFVELLRYEYESDPALLVAVIGSPADASRVRDIARAGCAEPVMTPRLRDAFALLDRADLLFTPDTGIAHAASALRKPAVVMVRRKQAIFAPYRTPGRVVYAAGETMDAIPVMAAAWALDSVLEALGAAPRPAGDAQGASCHGQQTTA